MFYILSFLMEFCIKQSDAMTEKFRQNSIFPNDNFSSIYWIFTKLDHMIALWKGKNPIYFGVIRSKVKVTYYK